MVAYGNQLQVELSLLIFIISCRSVSLMHVSSPCSGSVIIVALMKTGLGSKSSPKQRQRNKRVHKTIIWFMPSFSTNDLKLCIIHEDITSHTRIIGLSVMVYYTGMKIIDEY
jgi:hypothetical protein